MRVIGFDPSTHFGWATVSNNWHNSGVIHHKYKGDDLCAVAERLALYRQSIRHVLRDQQPTLVIMEGAAYGVRSNSAVLINSIGAVAKLCIHDANIFGIEVAPTALKKFVTGKGTAPKSMMLKCVYQQWRFDTNDDNIADAFGLAKLGEALVLGGDYSKERLAALTSVAKGAPSTLAAMRNSLTT